VRLQYALNPGGFLSLGGALPESWRFWCFSIASSGVMLAFAGLLLARGKSMTPTAFVALALVLGGGIGNLIDRWTQNGLVTDFLNLGIGPVRTGIFNIADMALCLGALILIASYPHAPKPKPAIDETLLS